MDQAQRNLLPHDLSDVGSLAYFFNSAIKGHSHIVPCYVVRAGDLTVDAIPIICSSRADGSPINNHVIKNIPILRNQSGKSAFIVTPNVNDVGLLLVSDKNTSNIAGAQPATAGSDCRFDMADSMYLGSIPHWGQQATEYIKMTGKPDGIQVVTPSNVTVKAGGNVTIEAPTVNIKGDVNVTGTIKATGEITSGSIALTQHKHGGVQSGNSTTDVPV